MYKQLFIYSPSVRRRNRISGLFSDLASILLFIPLIGLFISIIGYLIKPLNRTQIICVFVASMIIIFVIAVLKIIRFIKENSTTYGIDNEGQIIIMDATKNVSQFVDIDNMKSLFEHRINILDCGKVFMQFKKAFDNINSEESIEKKLYSAVSMGLIDSVEEKKKCIIIHAENNKVYKIRRVYTQVDELARYAQHLSNRYNIEEFEFSTDNLINDLTGRIKKRNFWTMSAWWAGIVGWIAIFGISSYINNSARIKSGEYVKTTAHIYLNENNSEQGPLAVYTANGKKVRVPVSKEKVDNLGSYVDIYYSKSTPEKYVLADNIKLTITPYIIIYIFGMAVILIISTNYKRS